MICYRFWVKGFAYKYVHGFVLRPDTRIMISFSPFMAPSCHLVRLCLIVGLVNCGMCNESRQDVSRECFSERSLRIDSERAHCFKRDDFQSALVRGLKNDAWSHVVLVGLLPAGGAETPAVSRLETGETVFWHGGGKVVPSEFGELKELGGHFHTNRVRTKILIIGVTTTVAKESRQRISATRLERTAQNIK